MRLTSDNRLYQVAADRSLVDRRAFHLTIRRAVANEKKHLASHARQKVDRLRTLRAILAPRRGAAMNGHSA